MSSYLTDIDDLADLADQVSVRGKEVIVNAIDLSQAASLMIKHKALRSVFGGSNGEEVDFYEVVMDGGSELIRDIIDLSTGFDGLGKKLNAVEQGNIVAACLAITFPENKEELSDFLEQITALANRASEMIER